MDEKQHSEFYCKGFFDSAPTPWTPPPPQTPGPEWERPQRERLFDLPWADEVLEAAYRRTRGAFCRRGAEGFWLAYPLDCRCPFPLPALFCFAKAECLGGRGWWVFSFGPDGLPRFQSA